MTWPALVPGQCETNLPIDLCPEDKSNQVGQRLLQPVVLLSLFTQIKLNRHMLELTRWHGIITTINKVESLQLSVWNMAGLSLNLRTILCPRFMPSRAKPRALEPFLFSRALILQINSYLGHRPNWMGKCVAFDWTGIHPKARVVRQIGLWSCTGPYWEFCHSAGRHSMWEACTLFFNRNIHLATPNSFLHCRDVIP